MQTPLRTNHARRFIRVFGVMLVALWGSLGFTHSGYILEVWSQPATPQAHEPFSLHVELRDLRQHPIADHLLLFVLEHPQHEALTFPAEEGEEGLYRSRMTLPHAGHWQVTLLDDTHGLREELTTLELTLNAHTEQAAQVVVPPNDPDAGLLRVWLWGLVGVVVLAGLVISVLVYRKGQLDYSASLTHLD